MAVIQSSDIGDLLRNSINRLNRGKFTEIATGRQKWIMTRSFMRKNKVVFDSGPLFQWNLMVDHSQSAEAVGLYAVDNVRQRDVMAQAVVPWRQLHASYPIDHHEITRNSGESKIVDILKTRRISCMIALMDLIETNIWKAPAVTDNLNMWGFPVWIVKNNTEGFNGTVPSGWSDVASVSTTTYQNWKNYTAQYTAVTKDDLIQKWARAAEFTDWEPPVDEIPDFDTGDGYFFGTNWNVLGTLRLILERQNDDLGNDLDSMHGRVRFQRSAVERIPELENDTTNPVYGVNLGTFKVATESGWWLKEKIIDVAAKQHNVSEYHVDLSFQPHCYNRRNNFVLATDTTMPA